ncbi:MAG: hypothetical protein SOT81_10260 [Treponema sp.]|nr:hypothetical protein [Treponema sp.]
MEFCGGIREEENGIRDTGYETRVRERDKKYGTAIRNEIGKTKFNKINDFLKMQRKFKSKNK